MGVIQLAVMGDPIEHSWSPTLHQRFAHESGIEIDYQKIRVNQDELPDALENFWSQGGIGLNLTSPLKEIAINHCDALDETAKQTHSVNTLHRIDNKVVGYNTDPDGFLYALHQENISVKDKEVLILGNGGAAKSVTYILIQQGAKVSTYHRTNPITTPKHYDMVINTFRRDATLEAFQQVPILSADIAFNLNYQETSSSFHEFSQKIKSKKYVSGEDMLLGQAAKAFGIWTGAVVSFGYRKSDEKGWLTK